MRQSRIMQLLIGVRPVGVLFVEESYFQQQFRLYVLHSLLHYFVSHTFLHACFIPVHLGISFFFFFLTLRDNKVELNCTERGENPESLHEVLNPVRFSLQDASSLSHLLRCRKCIKDEEGAVLLVVKQQGEPDKTLVDENGNGSGHI